MAKQNGNKSKTGSVLSTLLWTGAAVGAAALANAYIFYQTPPLTSKLAGGEIRYFPTPNGDIFYKKAGDGPPLVLVHGIGAGCSSYEWEGVWKSLTESHTVYALDLLGFGKSDKPAIEYNGQFYIALLDRFMREVVGVGGGRGECDVIASSLSAAFVVALSERDPSLFHRLVLVCPTGIEELASPPNATSAAIRTALKTPVLGTTIYNAIASRTGIRNYLIQNIYANPAKVTDEVVDYYYTSAHQPGADNVLPYFLAGYLNVNIYQDFKKIEDIPLIVWGRSAGESPLSLAEAFVLSNRTAKLEVIEEAGNLPHAEQPEAFLAAVRPFLLNASDENPPTSES